MLLAGVQTLGELFACVCVLCIDAVDAVLALRLFLLLSSFKWLCNVLEGRQHTLQIACHNIKNHFDHL